MDIHEKKRANLRCVFSTSLSQKGSQMLDLAAISLSLWPENQQKPPKLFAPFFYERTTMEETGHLLVFLLFFFRPPLSKDVHWLKAKTRLSRNNKHWICLTITKVGFKRGPWKENATRYSANGLTAEREEKKRPHFIGLRLTSVPRVTSSLKFPANSPLELNYRSSRHVVWYFWRKTTPKR